MKKLIYLEFLRFAAALLVFASHYAQTSRLTKVSHGWSFVDKFGEVGVDLFFVLSGFVISYSLSKQGNKTFSQFLKGRARRLLPIYLLLTSLAAILIVASERLELSTVLPKFDVLHLLASILFVSQLTGFGDPIVAQGWTLEMEVAFYFVAALALLGGGLTMRRTLLLILVLSLLGIGISPLFLEFALGIAAFLFFEHLVKIVTYRNLLAVCLIGIGVMSLVLNTPQDMSQRVESWGIGAFCVVLGSSLLQPKRLLGTFAGYLGALSYPLYLFQWLSIPITTRLFEVFSLPEGFFGFVLCLAVTWAGSHLLNQYWDIPIKRRMMSAGW